MFLPILTIAVGIAAVVYTVRNLIFTGLVERSWKEPMPGAGEEGHQEALQKFHRQQRTRMRSALAVVALFVASVVLASNFLAHLWTPNMEVIRLGGMLLGIACTLVVSIRAMVHEQRGSELRIKRDAERYWKDRRDGSDRK